MDGLGTVVRLQLEVAAAAALTIETTSAAGFASQVTLLDTDATTVLGVGVEPADSPGAARLTYAFAAAGTYYLDVSSTNAACGDLLLMVR